MTAEHEPDRAFDGSVPEVYERYLVPLIFEPYAFDLAARLGLLGGERVLEVAAGTGVLTRQLTARLPETTRITATDLNQPMLDHAATVGTSRPVTWRQADVMSLPFQDGSFDIVVCQFGVMFFPDRPYAYSEIRRVLRPGGTFVFNSWDRIGENDFARIVTDALGELFPDDPPQFLARTPHGYFDVDLIRADLVAAGFSLLATCDTVEARSRAASPRDPAVGYCQGTPLRNEIVNRDPSRLEEATSHSAAAIEREHGSSAVDGTISAHIIVVHAP